MKNETKNIKENSQFLAINYLLKEIKNEINKIDEKELIVINYADGNYYTYNKDSIKDLVEIYIDDYILIDSQNYTNKANEIFGILRKGDFWQFIVSDVLQHREKDSHYALVNNHIYDEVAFSGNE